MTDRRKSRDATIQAVGEALTAANNARCELRQADGSLQSTLRLVEGPPEMSEPHKALVKGNLVTADDLTRANTNARDRLAEAKQALERSIAQIDAALDLIHRLTG